MLELWEKLRSPPGVALIYVIVCLGGTVIAALVFEGVSLFRWLLAWMRRFG